MKLSIIGLGNVGNAIFQTLSNHYEVLTYDTKKVSNSLENVAQTDLCFIAVPTPTHRGKQDISAIVDTFVKLKNHKFKGVHVIKSTILPSTTNYIQKLFPKAKIIHNPEFLTERSADKDFSNLKRVVIGGHDMKDMQALGNIYSTLGYSTAWYVSPTQAEYIKYLHNCFLASKVAVLNEMYDIAKDLKVDYKSSIDIASEITGWINKKHIQVPGPDGWFGFGGACFPKDIEALTDKFHHCNLEILDAVISSNKHRRRKESVLPIQYPVERINLSHKPDQVIKRKRYSKKKTE